MLAMRGKNRAASVVAASAAEGFLVATYKGGGIYALLHKRGAITLLRKKDMPTVCPFTGTSAVEGLRQSVFET